jgi:anti-sigma B factor antagonist
VSDTSINTRRTDDGSVVIGVRGELDVASAEHLRAALIGAVNTFRPPKLVVDLQYVTLVDSAGIGVLVAGYHAIRAVGGVFEVSQPSALVHHQLRITGLADVLRAGPAPPSQSYSSWSHPQQPPA